MIQQTSNKVFKVGQVLYVVSNAGPSMKVYPIQIAEKTTRQTTDGESIQYAVALPGVTERIDLSELMTTSLVFESEDDARTTMIQRATNSINKIIDNAVALAQKTFRINQPLAQEVHVDPTDEETLVLVDGRPVKVNIKS